MEDLATLITRLKQELADARKTRDRILKVGQSSNFGGNSFSQVNLDLVLAYIRRLERDLYKAEMIQSDQWIDPDVRVSVVSQI